MMGWRIVRRLVVVVLLCEAVAYGSCVFYLRRALQSVFFDPPVHKALAGFDEYMARRDPLLGWPAPAVIGTGSLDETGARRSPAFPTPGAACVSVYGDSFAWGDETDDEHAWSNVLAKLLGCRIANYGVNGFGTDQAYLRFKNNTRDEAETVILSIYPHNALRNVNQYRALLTGEAERQTRAGERIQRGTYLSFKPRFVLSKDGRLELEPLPSVTKEQFRDLLHDPGRYLKREYFVPGGPAGPVPYRFPYSWRILQLMRNEQVRAGVKTVMTGLPSWAGFYSPTHPSGSFQVTAAIIRAFRDDAVARGQRPLILLLPTPSAVGYHESKGVWAYGELIEHLVAGGVEVVNMGPYFLEELHGRDMCEISGQWPRGCAGHFSEEGYAMMARIILRLLRERGWAPS
jgi:hypothetical protein